MTVLSVFNKKQSDDFYGQLCKINGITQMQLKAIHDTTVQKGPRSQLPQEHTFDPLNSFIKLANATDTFVNAGMETISEISRANELRPTSQKLFHDTKDINKCLDDLISVLDILETPEKLEDFVRQSNQLHTDAYKSSAKKSSVTNLFDPNQTPK